MKYKSIVWSICLLLVGTAAFAEDPESFDIRVPSHLSTWGVLRDTNGDDVPDFSGKLCVTASYRNGSKPFEDRKCVEITTNRYGQFRPEFDFMATEAKVTSLAADFSSAGGVEPLTAKVDVWGPAIESGVASMKANIFLTLLKPVMPRKGVAGASCFDMRSVKAGLASLGDRSRNEGNPVAVNDWGSVKGGGHSGETGSGDRRQLVAGQTAL